MKRYMGLRGRKLEVAILYGIVMPGFVLIGYNTSIAGGLVKLKSWEETFPIIDTSHPRAGNTSALSGLVISLSILGLAISSLMCVFVGPRLGRIRTMILGTGGFCIGAVIQSCSNTYGQMIAGRVVAGLHFGFAASTYAVYQQETTVGTAYKRGTLAAMGGVFNTAGFALAMWIAFGSYFTKSSASWRFPLAFPMAIAIYVCIFCCILPESPRWLMYKGRDEEARSVLAALTDNTPSAPEVESALSDMRTSLERTQETKIRDLFRKDDNRLMHRTVIAAAVMFFQQWTGINAVATYNSSLFAAVGLDATLSKLLSAAAFSWFTMASVIPYFLVERLGRRTLLITSSAGMAVCMAVLAGANSMPENHAALVAGVTFLFLYLTFMGVGFYGIPFFYAAEIGPQAYRSQITAIAYNFLFTYAFAISEITPVALTTIKYRYFIVFATCNAVIAIAVYFFFPETMSLSLEQIDQIFVETTSFFDCVVVAERVRKRALQAGADECAEGPLEATDVKAAYVAALEKETDQVTDLRS